MPSTIPAIAFEAFKKRTTFQRSGTRSVAFRYARRMLAIRVILMSDENKGGLLVVDVGIEGKVVAENYQDGTGNCSKDGNDMPAIVSGNR